MEWMLMNMDNFFTPSIDLGNWVSDDTYIVSPNCLEKIHEILRRLVQDKARWHFRRLLFMNKIISANLIPTLLNVKKNREVLGATIRLLQELLTPVECLMPIDIMGKNYEGLRIIQELEMSIQASKKLFLDSCVTKAIVDFMNDIMQETEVMTMENCETINFCLLLIRNLLHVHSSMNISSNASEGSNTDTDKDQTESMLPEKMTLKQPQQTQQNNQTSSSQAPNPNLLTEDQLMWNLFAQRFDNILIQLLTCPQQQLWNITMVQLVSLMYREQQQGTIRKLIGEWLESSIYESSEDDENNTMSSSSCDNASTDPISDSSERLSPVDGIEPEIKEKGEENSSNTSEKSKGKLDKDSSKDSGFGRSGSNNEGETSVDESMTENKKGKEGNKSNTETTKPSETTKDKKVMDPSKKRKIEKMHDDKKSKDSQEDVSESSQKLTTESSEMNDKDMTENQNYDSSEQDDTGIGLSTNVTKSISDTDMMQVDTNQFSDMNLEEARTSPNIGPVVIRNEDMYSSSEDKIFTKVETNVFHSPTPIKPPKEEETSGDSSENKPVPQLPKQHKTGQKRTRHAGTGKKSTEDQEGINESSNSTGSDCDDGPQNKRPLHQKPHKMLSKPRPAKLVQKSIQERNSKKSRLIKRKETKCVKPKALLHHHPTPEDISNLLKEFTIDFMLNGYSNLVSGLQCQVLLPYQIELDKSHLLWLITYFLRFAVELDLELSQVSPILSSEVVSYLVYEGVVMQEDLEIAEVAGHHNFIPQVRRLHLVVTALREFFASFEICMKKDQTTFDCTHLMRIKEELGQMVQVRQMFLLLIRMYHPSVLNINYLQDLVITNHRFLITQEAASPTFASSKTFDIVEHIKQFATVDIMRQYGRLLLTYDTNEEIVNDCVFTIMHHIAGDLRAVNVLLQPQILKIFTVIWSDSYELCVDWADLIEYVLRKCAKFNFSMSVDGERTLDTSRIMSSIADLEEMYRCCSTDINELELMKKIKEVCCDDSIEEPVDKEVIKKLLAKGFITEEECRKLCNEIPSPQITPIRNLERRIGIRDISLPQSILKKWPIMNSKCYLFEDKEHEDPPLSDGGKSMEVLDSESVVNNSDHHSNMTVIENEEKLEQLSEHEEHLSHTKDDVEEIPDYCSTASVGKATTVKSNRDSLSELGNTDIELEEPNVSMDEDTRMSKGYASDDLWEDNELVSKLIHKVEEEGFKPQLEWLQIELLEACYAKLRIIGDGLPPPEPVFLHFTLTSQSIPIIPWTSEMEAAFKTQSFQQLLSQLGFHLPTDTGKIFPRIPHFWGPEVLCAITKRLGPFKRKNLKKSVELMSELMDQLDEAKSRNPEVLKNMREFRDAMIFVPENTNDSTSLDTDESDESISICSMENNRSNSASPASSIDIKMMESIDECFKNDQDDLSSMYENELAEESSESCQIGDVFGFEEEASCNQNENKVS